MEVWPSHNEYFRISTLNNKYIEGVLCVFKNQISIVKPQSKGIPKKCGPWGQMPMAVYFGNAPARRGLLPCIKPILYFLTVFFFFFSKPLLQRVCKALFSLFSCIFGGPNILVSSVSKSNMHNSISSTIVCSSVKVHCAIATACSNVSSISPLPSPPSTFPLFVSF